MNSGEWSQNPDIKVGTLPSSGYNSLLHIRKVQDSNPVSEANYIYFYPAIFVSHCIYRTWHLNSTTRVMFHVPLDPALQDDPALWSYLTRAFTRIFWIKEDSFTCSKILAALSRHKYQQMSMSSKTRFRNISFTPQRRCWASLNLCPYVCMYCEIIVILEKIPGARLSWRLQFSWRHLECFSV
jgi:hypothetical protein